MFGKKEAFRLHKLNVGDSFKLKNIRWTILEIGLYDWRNYGQSFEYKIESKQGVIAYLEVELIKNNYEVYFSEAVFIENPLLQDAVISKSILYLNQEFKQDEYYKGMYKNETNHSNWERLESFIFCNENNKILTIEKWEDGSFETFYGEEISAKKIKKIISRKL